MREFYNGFINKKLKYIKMYMPFFSLTIYMAIVLVLSGAVGMYYKESGFIGAITYSLTVFSIGIFIFTAVAEVFHFKVKKMHIEFISYLTGYAGVSNNPVQALKEAAEFSPEIIKKVLSKNIRLYEIGQITIDEMYRRISDEMVTEEFLKLFRIIQMAEENGGDYTKNLDRQTNYASEDYDLSSQMSTTQKGGVLVIFLMLGIDLAALSQALTTPEILVNLSSTQGSMGLISNLAFVIGSLLLAWRIMS